MSIFNKDQIQTPPNPQKCFEILCEEELWEDNECI